MSGCDKKVLCYHSNEFLIKTKIEKLSICKNCGIFTYNQVNKRKIKLILEKHNKARML